MRTALLGVAGRAAAAVEGGTVATMNAVTKESLDWNATRARPTCGRRVETVRNSASNSPSVFECRPHVINKVESAARPTGSRRLCQNLFNGDGLFRFPYETSVRRPKENA
jgi:hypothetical protein